MKENDPERKPRGTPAAGEDEDTIRHEEYRPDRDISSYRQSSPLDVAQ